MTGHLTREELEGFRRQPIDPQKLLRADRHLADCAQCQRQLRSVVPAPALTALVQECEEPLHPSFEQISAFIDSGDEWVERHIQCCSRCAAEVNDLKQFDARVAATGTQPETARASWLQWLWDFFAAPERPRFAAASLSLLALGFLAMAQLQVGGGPTESRTMLEQVTQSNPGQFYGGFVVASVGLAGVLYRIFRRK